MNKPDPGAFVVSKELEEQLGYIHGGLDLLDAYNATAVHAAVQRDAAEAARVALRAKRDEIIALGLQWNEANKAMRAENDAQRQRADELAAALEGVRGRWTGCWCESEKRHDKECLAAQAALAAAAPKGKP